MLDDARPHREDPEAGAPTPAPLIRFHRLIGRARAPQRADRAAGGLLPTRAFRYCEAVTTASAFGWYIFPPISFSLVWTGEDLAWSFDGADSWYPLGTAQFPGFSDEFDRMAPELGAHTDEVLISLGYDREAIADLRARDIV